ncbi:MAG: hypothetical protein ACLQU1_40860 [Bryobacteraceae bacterium]
MASRTQPLPQPLRLRQLSPGIKTKVNAFNGGMALFRRVQKIRCKVEPLLSELEIEDAGAGEKRTVLANRELGAVRVWRRPEKVADCAHGRCLLRLCKFYDHPQTWRERSPGGAVRPGPRRCLNPVRLVESRLAALHAGEVTRRFSEAADER